MTIEPISHTVHGTEISFTFSTDHSTKSKKAGTVTVPDGQIWYIEEVVAEIGNSSRSTGYITGGGGAGIAATNVAGTYNTVSNHGVWNDALALTAGFYAYGGDDVQLNAVMHIGNSSSGDGTFHDIWLTIRGRRLQ